MPHPDEAIACILGRDGYIEGIAAFCAQQVVEKCFLRQGWAPDGFDDAAVIRRADKDIEIDFRMDADHGFETTEAQREEYRRRYRDAFLRSWRDPDAWEKLRTKPRGFIIVCYR
jgi:hypothetical protein